MDFIFDSYVGARPILFGSSRDAVDKILGQPTWEQRGGRRAMYGGDDSVIVEFDINRHVEFIQIHPNNRAMFEGKNLLEMTYGAAEQLLKNLDKSAENSPKDSVGIISYLLGIGIFCPEGTDNPDAEIENVYMFRRSYYELPQSEE